MSKFTTNPVKTLKVNIQVLRIRDTTTIKQIQDFGAAFHSDIRLGNEGLTREDVYHIKPGDYIVKSGNRFHLWCKQDFEDMFAGFEEVVEE